MLYISIDAPRIQHETHLVMKGMAAPRVIDKARLLRVVRFLLWSSFCGWCYKFQKPPCRAFAFCDADHARDADTRRSNSCIQTFLGDTSLNKIAGSNR